MVLMAKKRDRETQPCPKPQACCYSRGRRLRLLRRKLLLLLLLPLLLLLLMLLLLLLLRRGRAVLNPPARSQAAQGAEHLAASVTCMTPPLT